MKTEEQTELTNEEPVLDEEENVEESLLATLKPFLLAILGLGLVMSILVLLPMFLTYLSEGNVRP